MRPNGRRSPISGSAWLISTASPRDFAESTGRVETLIASEGSRAVAWAVRVRGRLALLVECAFERAAVRNCR